MDTVAPRNLRRRVDNVTPLIITNQCPDAIYPGINTQSGDGPQNTGFKLDPGESQNQTVSEDWQGRIWGRTNCSFNSDGTGPANGAVGNACGSGDCGGILACKVTVRLAGCHTLGNSVLNRIGSNASHTGGVHP